LPTTGFILVPIESGNFINDIAATPPNLTCETFAKLFPMITTVCPVAALVGEEELMVVSAKSDSATTHHI
jgi:hypothetical protein